MLGWRDREDGGLGGIEGENHLGGRGGGGVVGVCGGEGD